MFHDQVLAPFKGIFKFDADNITLGTKIYWKFLPHLWPDKLISKIERRDEICLNVLVCFKLKVNL